jgi:YHS domain-containing protein
MEMRRCLWGVAVVMGLGGCGGEEGASAPGGPASGPAVKPAPKPAVPAAGTAKQPATVEPGKGEAGKAPAADGKGAAPDAPPLEAPKTGAADEVGKVKLRKLPESEQAAAIRQGVCPVSGEALGSMGTPIKVSAEGRTFYLCCDGCEDKVKSDPKGVIAKLDQN